MIYAFKLTLLSIITTNNHNIFSVHALEVLVNKYMALHCHNFQGMSDKPDFFSSRNDFGETSGYKLLQNSNNQMKMEMLTVYFHWLALTK